VLRSGFQICLLEIGNIILYFIMTLFYFNILLFIQFLVYSSCILYIDVVYDDYCYMIVKLLIQYSSESGGAHYVDVVSRYIVYLWRHPDVSGRVVVRIGNTYIGSSVVHPPYVGLAERGRERGDVCVLKSSLVDAPYDVF